MSESQDYLHPSLYVGESKISGLGLFASEPIEAETLLYYEHELGKQDKFLNFNELDSLSDESKEIFLKNAYQIDDDLWLGYTNVNDIVNSNDLSLYWNHSCSPNTYFQGNNKIYSLRDIAKGEEVTYDYCTSDSYPFPAEYFRFLPYYISCECGSPICRKVLFPDDWKKPELQRKYKGKFLPYLEKKIRNSSP